MKRALVLGAGGQDGSYLCDILLERGYAVHGLVRHSSVDNLKRIRPLLKPSPEGITPITLHHGDVTDLLSLRQAINAAEPDEVYNMADQDNVGWSFANKLYQVDVTYKAVAGLLEYLIRWSKKVKLFQPVSATMFGMAPPPQNENTPLDPRSPYAVAKAAVFHLCRHYRQDHGLHVNCGIMFNHDSPRRAEGYLLGKICKAALSAEQNKPVNIPNSQLRVDVSYAKDCMSRVVDLMRMDESDDYCIGSGEGYAVEQMARHALEEVGVGWDAELAQETELNRGPQPTLIADLRKLNYAIAGPAPRNAYDTIRILLIHLKKEQR